MRKRARYDNCPNVYPGVVEKEYAKLEPYINIFSSRVNSRQRGTTLSPEALEFFEIVEKVLNRYPEKFDKFEKFMLEL